jgi:hypothetical protein
MRVHGPERYHAADFGEHRQHGEPDPLRPFLVSQKGRADLARRQNITVRPVTSVPPARRYRRGMMALREIMIWIIQAVLFGIGIGFAGLTAHLAGPLLATAFAIDELIPTALVFFAVAAGLGWLGNRFWPEDWLYNPLI